MSILWWILLGALAGWIASMVMDTNRSQGAFMNIAVGIVGALIGGFLFQTFGEAGVTGFNLYSLVVATIGSIVLLWIVKLVRK